MRSPMIHQFSQVPKAEIQRSRFLRQWSYKTTMDSGYLVPFYVDEALPGDTFNLKVSLFGRFSTPIVPIMDNVYLETFFFAVPIRLVWDNFARFMGEQKDPGDSIDYVVPQVDCITDTHDVTFGVGSIFDYMGIPPDVPDLSVCAFWPRAYNLIYNEWFRDENLQNSAVVTTADGGDHYSDYPLRKRCKRKDYFTSALPWPQKGPGVELPISGLAPVVTGDPLFGDDYAGSAPLSWRYAYSGTAYDPAESARVLVGIAKSTSDEHAHTFARSTDVQGTATGGIVPSSLYADLGHVASATINTMRQAFQVQRFMELQARGGTRYTEIIRSCFNVVSPDARLQRPEYLGGGHSQIHFQPLAQTSSTDSVSPQANVAAYGVVGDQHHGFVKSFTEHCVIIGIVNVRADVNYQQGLNRMWSRKTRYDFYWPTFAHLGEQAVFNKEIYAQGENVKDSDGNIVDDQVFGYQERYAEYRYYPNLITGKFRSSDPQSLDVWHLAQDFSELPKLNSEFIEEAPPIKRILAVQDEPELLLDCLFTNVSTRPMPLYGVPGLADHF